MDWLMMSTARSTLSLEALAREPLSGSLFGAQLPDALGLPEELFDDTEIAE